MLNRSWLVAPPVAGAAAWGVPPAAGCAAAAPPAVPPAAVGAAGGGALAHAATIGVATAARVAAPVHRSRERRPKGRDICGSSLHVSAAEYIEYEKERRTAVSGPPSQVRPRGARGWARRFHAVTPSGTPATPRPPASRPCRRPARSPWRRCGRARARGPRPRGG